MGALAGLFGGAAGGAAGAGASAGAAGSAASGAAAGSAASGAAASGSLGGSIGFGAGAGEAGSLSQIFGAAQKLGAFDQIFGSGTSGVGPMGPTMQPDMGDPMERLAFQRRMNQARPEVPSLPSAVSTATRRRLQGGY